MNKIDWLFMWGVIGVLTVIPQTLALYGVRTGNGNMALACQIVSMFWIAIVSRKVIVYAYTEKDKAKEQEESQ